MSALNPVVSQAIQDLCDFANNHAHDTYEPEENLQNQESYEHIMSAVKIIKRYLDNN